MKKLLSTFIIWCICLISFCSSYDTYDFSSCSRYYCALATINTYNWTYCIVLWQDSVWNSAGAFSAVYFDNSNTSSAFDWSSWPNFVSSYVPFWTNRTWNVFLGCFNNNWFTNYNRIHSYTSSNNIRNKEVYIYSWSEYMQAFWPSCPTCPTCPECEICQTCPTTWEILSWYILESSVDSNYCVENELCPSCDTPICTWDNWSALLINDEQYDSAWIINVSIPSDYWFDYDNDWDQVDLTVEWYNVDAEYIEWIINNQKSKPNQTDLNNIITWLLPLFIPWLVVILFIYFVFKFLKKIF